MSGKDQLIVELAAQPDRVAAQLLDYLHLISPISGLEKTKLGITAHWDRFVGAWADSDFERPPQGHQAERESW